MRQIRCHYDDKYNVITNSLITNSAIETNVPILSRHTQQIWRDGFKILQHAHPVGVAQNLVGFLVVAKADVGGGDEQVEGIVFVYVQIPVLRFFLRMT